MTHGAAILLDPVVTRERPDWLLVSCSRTRTVWKIAGTHLHRAAPPPVCAGPSVCGCKRGSEQQLVQSFKLGEWVFPGPQSLLPFFFFCTTARAVAHGIFPISRPFVFRCFFFFETAFHLFRTRRSRFQRILNSRYLYSLKKSSLRGMYRRKNKVSSLFLNNCALFI